jgi:hypothetical protein
VIDEAEKLPPADFTLLVSDLPDALNAAHADAPARDPALQIPSPLSLPVLEEQRARIRARLAQAGPPPYIGLTWRGGTAPEEQKAAAWMLFKEIPIEKFGATLRDSKGTMLALQRNPAAGEIEKLAQAMGRPLHDFSDLNEDLEGMLALLAEIDDYFGVSNTNMHLRAGVGRQARVLVPCPPEWRWMAEGESSPWFPGFNVYRQAIDGNWAAALTRLAADLGRA